MALQGALAAFALCVFTPPVPAQTRPTRPTAASQTGNDPPSMDEGSDMGVAEPKSKVQLPNSKIPEIKAASAILIDAVSGQVLYQKNADQPRPMASTTKIMTALLFCERVPDENTLVVASKYASTIRESSLHLKPKEKISAHDLLRAILMRSANDACVAAAEHVAGNVPAFADLMNQRAAQLGCTHTHFVNPNGLHDKLHYTSARDLAQIARQAIQEPRIAEVTSLRKCRITRSLDKFDVTMRNHSQKFLDKYAGADGIKTGWTIPAGHCFVGSATRDNWRLIAVVLKSPDFVHETAALMDYGFANFAPRVLARAGDPQGVCKVSGGVAETVPIVARKTIEVALPKEDDSAPGVVQTHLVLRPQSAPLKPGAEVGVLEAQLNGVTLCETPLTTTKGVSAAPKSVLTASGGRGSKTLLWLASIFLAGVVSFRYYGKRITTSTKSARRRWRRLSKSLRNAHR